MRFSIAFLLTLQCITTCAFGHELQKASEVSEEKGKAHLEIILMRYPFLIKDFDKCRENDKAGHPQLIDCQAHGFFSPETLQYMKIAGDLKSYFGDLSDLDVVEIGGSHEGLCKILRALGGFKSYTIINNADVDIKKTSPNIACDLLISTGHFSELDINAQKQLLENLILKAPNGYLACPSLSSNDQIANRELVGCLYHAKKRGLMEDEIPQNSTDNKEIIKWRTLEKCQVYKGLTEKNKDPLAIPKDPLANENFVTYSFSGGRFGDNLIAYLHAKWISYKYNLPLLFVPFEYSDTLQCHHKEKRQEQIETLRDKNPLAIHSNRHFFEVLNNRSTIFCLDYYPECFSEYIHTNDPNKYPYFFIDWEDPNFSSEVRDALKPISPPETFEIPNNKISVAVHVRKGGGFDPSNVNLIHPLKLPDDSYYIEQIKTIHELLNKAPLFVHIFTDHQNPSEIVDSYSKHFQNQNIEFSCRKTNNSHNANVLEDFFMLTKFDCLIRTSSNYSFVASKLADYEIIISPTQCAAKDGRYVVSKVCVEFNPQAKNQNNKF